MCWIFGDHIFQERSDFLKVFIDCQVFVSVTITFIFDIIIVPKMTNFVIIFFFKRVLTSLVILSFIASFCFCFFQFEKIFYTLNCVINFFFGLKIYFAPGSFIFISLFQALTYSPFLSVFSSFLNIKECSLPLKFCLRILLEHFVVSIVLSLQ